MDDEVRRMRAQRYGEPDAPVDSSTDHVVKEELKLNFGGARPGSGMVSGDSGVDDADSILRQRRSMPYSNPNLGRKEDLRPQSQSTPSQPESQSKPEPDIDFDAKPGAEPHDRKEDRQCRICLSSTTTAPNDRLISPCKCRGTSKFVHLSCLNEWRRLSTNRQSFYRCDQCHYSYSFYRTRIASYLLHPAALSVATLLAMVFATFLSGFVVKFCLYMLPRDKWYGRSSWFSSTSSWLTGSLFFYSPLDAGQDLLDAATLLVPSTPRRLIDVFKVDVYHFVSGFASLGLIGLLGLFGTGGIFGVRTFFGGASRRRRQQGRRGDGGGVSFGEAAFILVLLLGLAKVAFSMWGIIRKYMNRRLTAMHDRILEVDPE